MNAKASDLARVQEMFNLIRETQRQIENLGITEDRLKMPASDTDQLFAEAIMNRVFRITEEAGALSDEALAKYEFDRRSIKGVRNRLAHTYGDVSSEIVWEIVKEDFPKLIEGCQLYSEDHGVELASPVDEKTHNAEGREQSTEDE